MLVETYEVEGVSSHPEVSEEQTRLIESMGLEGQASLVSRVGSGSNVCPYRQMSDREDFVFSELCPQQTLVESYSSGPIPLRVLQVLEHARSLGRFDYFEVWHPSDATIPDPVLVAYEGKRFHPQKRYILARWGEVLDEMPALCRIAGQRWRARMLSLLKSAIGKAQSEAATIEAISDADVVDVKRSPYNAEPAFVGILA